MRPYARPLAGFNGAASRRRKGGAEREKRVSKEKRGCKLEQGRRLAKAGPDVTIWVRVRVTIMTIDPYSSTLSAQSIICMQP